jgi:hypothetical protein
MLVLSWMVAVTVFPCAVQGQPNLLPNGHFTSDVSGWMFEGDIGTELGWDGSLGSPVPGSLRLSNDGAVSGLGVAEALSVCFEPTPGALFRVEARTFAQGNVLCRSYISRYEGAGCTGDRSRFGFSGTVVLDEENMWIGREHGESAPQPRPSFRVALHASLDGSGAPSSCKIDAVVLTDQAALEVPTVSQAGLVLLALALVLVGLWYVRSS